MKAILLLSAALAAFGFTARAAEPPAAADHEELSKDTFVNK